MKRLVFTLLLSVVLYGAAVACPGDGSCPQSDQIQELADIDILAAQAIDAAVTLCEKSAGKIEELSPQIEMTCFGVQNSISFLKTKGVSEDDLAPLVAIQDKLLEVLKTVEPLYTRGIITIVYAGLQEEQAGGNPVGLFRSASLFCQAAEYLSAASDALEGTEKVIEEAKETTQKLFESLQSEEES